MFLLGKGGSDVPPIHRFVSCPFVAKKFHIRASHDRKSLWIFHVHTFRSFHCLIYFLKLFFTFPFTHMCIWCALTCRDLEWGHSDLQQQPAVPGEHHLVEGPVVGRGSADPHPRLGDARPPPTMYEPVSQSARRTQHSYPWCQPPYFLQLFFSPQNSLRQLLLDFFCWIWLGKAHCFMKTCQMNGKHLLLKIANHCFPLKMKPGLWKKGPSWIRLLSKIQRHLPNLPSIYLFPQSQKHHENVLSLEDFWMVSAVGFPSQMMSRCLKRILEGKTWYTRLCDMAWIGLCRMADPKVLQQRDFRVLSDSTLTHRSKWPQARNHKMVESPPPRGLHLIAQNMAPEFGPSPCPARHFLRSRNFQFWCCFAMCCEFVCLE